tara:strand:- start:912 stop:1136 length:225 start_codon:yes stop_codon:yes gene_type:complete
MADIERKVAKKIYDAIDGDYTLISRLVGHIEDVADKSGLEMHQGGDYIYYEVLEFISQEIADSILANSDEVDDV